jgi:hypothetical protein
MKWFFVICSVAVALICSPEAWAKTQRVESTQIGAWALSAFAGDPDEYASCSVSKPNDAGVVFGVWADSLVGWRMWLGADGWRLTEGAEYDVRYAIDDQAPVAAKAIAVLDNSVHIHLGDVFASTEVLRRARRISVQTAQGTFSFDLSGSARALDGMRDCARRWLRMRDVSADPFSRPPSPSDPDIPQRMPGSLNDFLKPVMIGPWKIGAQIGILYHAFTECTATPPPAAGGQDLVIRLDRRLDWRMYVMNMSWNLKPGVPLTLRYSVDGGPVTPVEGKVIIPQSTTLTFGKEPALIDALRRGRSFRFQANGEDFTFDLSGVGRALDATMKCVKFYAAEE